MIDHGHVVAEGTPNELKKSIGNATLVLGIKHKKYMAEAAKIVEKTLKVKTQQPEQTVITAPMKDADTVTDLLIKLRTADIEIDELSVQKPTLDEVFFAITGKPAEKKEHENE